MREGKARNKKRSAVLQSKTAPEPPVDSRPEQEETRTRESLLQQAQDFKSFMETLESDPKNKEILRQTADGESFLYLEPQDGNVYNFKAVDYQNIDQGNYHTLSDSGVTHFMGNDTQFTSLQQYEREYYLYAMVTKIPFFAKYRTWKTFTVWKKNVTAKKSCALQGAVARAFVYLAPVAARVAAAAKKSVLQSFCLQFVLGRCQYYVHTGRILPAARAAETGDHPSSSTIFRGSVAACTIGMRSRPTSISG
jgi:hypothetical protein